MERPIDLLDQALDLARREKAHLADDDVDLASELSRERTRLLFRAFEGKGTWDDPAILAEIRKRLARLSEIQETLTEQARAMRDTLRTDLLRTKKETTRMSGYRQTVKPKPIHSRYISKQG